MSHKMDYVIFKKLLNQFQIKLIQKSFNLNKIQHLTEHKKGNQDSHQKFIKIYLNQKS